MTRPPSPLIAQLASELEPVRPIRMAHGRALLALSMLATIGVVALGLGLWSGPLQGEAAVMFFVANALIGLVGVTVAETMVLEIPAGLETPLPLKAAIWAVTLFLLAYARHMRAAGVLR